MIRILHFNDLPDFQMVKNVLLFAKTLQVSNVEDHSLGLPFFEVESLVCLVYRHFHYHLSFDSTLALPSK